MKMRHQNAEEEHEYVAGLLDDAAEGERRVHVWKPRPQVAFGRRDTASESYGDAVEVARRHSLAPTVRNVGGRAVVHAGATVGFAVAQPIDDMAQGLHDRYGVVKDAVQNALDDVHSEVECKEFARSFCPGEYSLSVEGRKVAGIAQRVRRDAALVSGAVIVGEREATARALEEVYAALELDFDPSTVGSLSGADVSVTVDGVAKRLETALVN